MTDAEELQVQQEALTESMGEDQDEEEEDQLTESDDCEASVENRVSYTQVNARRSQLSVRMSKRTADGKILLPDEVQKGADALEFESRNVYESTKAKMVLSVMVSSFALTLFGFCTSSGGRAEALYTTSLAFGDTDIVTLYNSTTGNSSSIHVEEFVEIAFDGHAYLDLDEENVYRFSQAYGFACFCYLISTLLALIAAVRISPLCCGAVGEMATTVKFQNWDEHHFIFGLRSPSFRELAQKKKDDEYRNLQRSDTTSEDVEVS